MLVEFTEVQLKMSENVLNYATNDEIKELRKICENIICRVKNAKAEMKKGGTVNG